MNSPVMPYEEAPPVDAIFDSDRLLTALDEANLDALVVTSRPNFIYLTGVYQQTEASFARQRHDAGAVVGRQGGRLSVIPVVPCFDVLFVQTHTWAPRTIGFQELSLKSAVGGKAPMANLADTLPQGLVQAVQEIGVAAGRVGFEDETLPTSYADYLRSSLPGATLVPAEGFLESVRVVKTPEEIRRLKESARIMEEAHQAVRAALFEGVTEWDLAGVVRKAMLKGRADRIVFVDIGFAEHLSPHGEPTDRPLARGEVVTFDGGVAFKGYLSDIGRSYVLGEASDYQLRAYETCLASFERQRSLLGPGLVVSEVYRAQADDLGDYFAAFPLPFVGHGLGLEVHEPPYLSADSSVRLEVGMVINIEPGIWSPGKQGIFLENSFVITEGGCEPLCGMDYTALTL